MMSEKFSVLRRVFTVIIENGGLVMLVGGVVRDFLLQKSCLTLAEYIDKNEVDLDVATSLVPEKINEIFKPYGTVKNIMATNIVVIKGVKCEITTLRKDVDCDGRRAKFEYTQSLFEDANRRDFTINALYSDLDGNITDFFSGSEDLKNGLVKFIGDPGERIREDYLRILRFFRFTARFCSDVSFVHTRSLQACVDNIGGFGIISGDRIKMEFFKLIRAEGFVQTLKLMRECGVLQYIIKVPENFENVEVFDAFLRITNCTKRDFIIYLFITGFEPRASIPLSKEELRLLSIFGHNRNVDDTALKFMFFELLPEVFFNILGIYAVGRKDMGWYDDRLKYFEGLLSELPIFPIKGEDMILLGIKGSRLGELLNELKIRWIGSEYKLNKEELLAVARLLVV